SFVLVNLIALGFIHLDPQSPGIIADNALSVSRSLEHSGVAHFISVITVGVASCVLAYSGIESVIQTAGLVQGWRDIAKAYWFLALTVGIVTPVVSALAPPPPLHLKAPQRHLLPHYATPARTL